MAQLDALGGGRRLYLDDIEVGQRFTSGMHAIDEAQIKAFARQFDPQPFHLDGRRLRTACLAGLWRVAGTQPLSPCASWLRADCRLRVA